MDLGLEYLRGAVEFLGDAGAATGKMAKGLDTVKALFKKSEMKFQLMALQNELAKAQAFQSDLDCYDLWETPAGAIVYRLRQEAADNQPLHYLCPKCIEGKRKSILQGHVEWRQCTTCKADYTFASDSGVTII